jgi:hypothetical protein
VVGAMPPPSLALRGAGRKNFFFEKKKQKTFVLRYTRPRQPQRKLIKVFWFFFSKKNCFPFACLPSAEVLAL